ncbi:MAG: Glu/Leu/Phe/Val dehydrogenase dimerization domain-containing protein [Bacillota bacterium]
MFRTLEQGEYEQVIYGYDKFSGLKAIIALHNTTLGPGFGGTRMMNYESDDDALNDVLKLSRAMTYKNAAAGIDFGGGKAVIIGDPKRDKNEDVLRAFGKLIATLNGRYITGIDIGTVEEDMVVISKETACCVALPESYGGVGSTSAVTAYGLFQGMKAAVGYVFGEQSLKNKSVAVQGLGNVGLALARYLHEEGAKIYASDISEECINRALKELTLEIVPPDQIYALEVDIFSPCALGGVLNDQTIPRLQCKLIAGGANNQLENDEKHWSMLNERGIAYGVDYILNAGGVIANSHQFIGYIKKRAYEEVHSNITNNIRRVFKIAERDQISTVEAANNLAEHRLRMAINRKKWYFS